MSIDFGNLKNVLAAIKNAANFETIDNKKEVTGAKNQSTFYGMIKADSVGDMFTKTTNDETKDEVSVQDLLSFVGPDVDKAKVNKYIIEKPVVTIKPAVTDPIAKKMAELTEGLDQDKLNAYLDTAAMAGTGDRLFSTQDLENSEDLELAGQIVEAYQA